MSRNKCFIYGDLTDLSIRKMAVDSKTIATLDWLDSRTGVYAYI